MTNHTKPTGAELDEQINKSLQEVEIIDNPPTPEPKKEEKPAEPPIEKPEEKKDITPEQKTEIKPEDEPDYKKKFTESSREAQILHAKNKKINDAIEEAKKISDVAEEELKKKYPNWDDLDDTVKQIAKDNLINQKRFEFLDGVTKESKDIEAWNKKVDEYIENPETLVKNPKLEGKQEEFKVFASKQSRRGVEFDTLVSAFLYEAETTKPTPKKGSMFETPSGGANTKPTPKNNKISVAESAILRVTDYKKYTEMLKAGLIETEIPE